MSAMAPKKVRVSRNPDLIPGMGKYSRSQMYHKRGLWTIKAKNGKGNHKRGLWATKAKNGGVFPRHDKKPAEQPSAVKAPKFYPADDVKKPLVNKRFCTIP